jgi:hypothetical protein
MEKNLEPQPEIGYSRKIQTIVLTVVLALLVLFNFSKSSWGNRVFKHLSIYFQNAQASNQFSDNFDDIKLNEAGKMGDSSSDDWWLNSGGYFYSKNGVAHTFQKIIPKSNRWHKRYNKSNSRDTDKGAHPQNVFRLVTRSQWTNLSQQVYFRINRNNLSKSKYRNESNGLLLFNRYQDGDNLYYAGIRVDGRAVIKKKIDGNYFTMAQKRVYQGKYDRKNKPNLLPKHAWIGVKSEVVDNDDGTVTVNLYLDQNHDNAWDLVLTAVDDNSKYGGDTIRNAGHGGIRTDFMDVDMDNYKMEEIE